jgi:hypothetical protein
MGVTNSLCGIDYVFEGAGEWAFHPEQGHHHKNYASVAATLPIGCDRNHTGEKNLGIDTSLVGADKSALA